MDQILRFITLTLAAGIALPPALPAHTAKELIRDACYNELQQFADKTLWSYRAERRSGNRIFLEEVTETVDGAVRHLLAVDGHLPTPAETKEQDDRNQELLKNPSGRRAIQKQREDDDRKMGELLRIIPEAFVFKDLGKEGEFEKIAFHPDPGFKPKSYEQRILHALDGILFIDLDDKRIAGLSGSLKTRVEFGLGVLGHVDQGGTMEITRVHLSPGVWKTSLEKIDIDGRFVVFKTINKHQDESRTGFEPVVSGNAEHLSILYIGGVLLIGHAALPLRHNLYPLWRSKELTGKQVIGFSLFLLKETLDGNMEEVEELIASNLHQ